MALAFPQVMTGGYGWVQWGAIGMPPALTLAGESSFVPHMGMWLLLALAVLKIVATGLTISSGGSGGVFGPSMLIGGMLGGFCGQLMAWMPGAAYRPGRVCTCRNGRILRRGFQDPVDLDRDGQRDDRLVQPARPLDAGLRSEHGDLAALDHL